MTQRFPADLKIRVSHELINDLDRVARAQELPRSAIIRQYLRQGLARDMQVSLPLEIEKEAVPAG